VVDWRCPFYFRESSYFSRLSLLQSKLGRCDLDVSADPVLLAALQPDTRSNALVRKYVQLCDLPHVLTLFCVATGVTKSTL
jgi:hypothetical protein